MECIDWLQRQASTKSLGCIACRLSGGGLTLILYSQLRIQKSLKTNEKIQAVFNTPPGGLLLPVFGAVYHFLQLQKSTCGSAHLRLANVFQGWKNIINRTSDRIGLVYSKDHLDGVIARLQPAQRPIQRLRRRRGLRPAARPRDRRSLELIRRHQQ